MSRTSPNKTLYKPPYDHQKDEVLALINEGWPDSKIAAHFGVTKDTIWCRRLRWGFPSGSEIRDRNRIDDITELWKHGYTVEEISDVLGISECVIYVKMREHGIRDIPRLGLGMPSMSLSELGHRMTEESDYDQAMLITWKRLPRFVLIPVDDYLQSLQEK